jgi:hypothetical protein
MCDENRGLLAERGVLYPKGRWHGQLGSYFARNKSAYIYNRHSGNIDLDAIEATDTQYIQALLHEIINTQCDKMIVSYEGYIDLIAEDLVGLRTFMREYFDQFLVIGYCRHPLSFAPSEISQRARMGVPTGLHDVEKLPIPKFRDYFEKFVSVFGVEQVCLTEFAPHALYMGDIRFDFLQKIGLKDLDKIPLRLNEDLTNESLSFEAVILAEALAKKMGPPQRANLFFMKYDRLLTSIKGASIALTKQQRQSIMSNAQSHLKYIEETFGLKLRRPSGQRSQSSAALFNEEAITAIANQLASDVVSQGFKWLLGREPESEDVVFGHLKATAGDWRRVRTHIMRSPEFHRSVDAISNPSTGSPEQVVPVRDVTVCMIVLNEEELLPATLRELARYFASFVILDMGSEDHTLDVVRDTLGKRARIVSYERKRLLAEGYSEARNYCAQLASSPWILMVDADERLVSGIDTAGIHLDRATADTLIATVARENLKKTESVSTAEAAMNSAEVRHVEHPRRLYRKSSRVKWSGYIHEELAVDDGIRSIAKSSLVFKHLSEFREMGRIRRRRSMYFWMLLRAYENQSLRGTTSSYWYERFVPENLEHIKTNAKIFREEDPDAGAAVILRPHQTSLDSGTPVCPAPNAGGVREF